MTAEPDERLVALLRSASRILFFTGAGISTGSGIPDFRGPQGVWQKRRPVYFQDFLRSEEARVEHWDFKLEGWPQFRQARPTPTHRAIADLEGAGRVQLVVTQNIDGLHGKAGTCPARLVEIHGTNAVVACLTCGARSDPEPHFDSFRRTRVPPRCACGGLLKPATISFGQDLVTNDLQRAAAGAERADLVIALGSTLSVCPAANVPLMAGPEVPYVVINRGATEHDGHPRLTLRLEGDVQALFPPAVAAALAADPKVAPAHV